MSLLSTLKFISNHPLNRGQRLSALWRFLSWQVRSRLHNQDFIHSFTNKSKLIIRRGMTGATGNLYCGLHEYEDMAFVLHFLRPGDLFADIGSNVGTYTVLASAHAGAATFSFEPLPETFAQLQKNIDLNHIENNVSAFNIALGAAPGRVAFTRSLDTMNRVAVHADTDTLTVALNTLDLILENKQTPVLLKIDVEGFETEVIKGAEKTLAQPGLKAIIIELNGSGAAYQYRDIDIHQTLVAAGFQPYQYNPEARAITLLKTFGPHNTIYLRDPAFVQQRLHTAESFTVFNKKI